MKMGDVRAARQLGQGYQHFVKVSQVVQHHRIEQVRLAQSIDTSACVHKQLNVLTTEELRTEPVDKLFNRNTRTIRQPGRVRILPAPFVVYD